MQLNGERKYGDNNQLQIPKEYADYLSKKPEQFTFSFELSFALNYPSHWQDNGVKIAEKQINNFLDKLEAITLGGTVRRWARYIQEVDYELQTEPSLTFYSSVNPFELAS